MEFGSVKFFRRLISLGVLVVIAVLIVALCFMGYRINKLGGTVGELKSELTQNREASDMLSQDSESMYYQDMFSDLYAEMPKERTTADKTLYLTFDDGPSEVTADILDVLKEYDVKATFFVSGKTGDEEKKTMKRIVQEGHEIGIHTYSHSYTDIYSSVDAYLDDFSKEYRLVYETTGVKPEVFRFPGGTINKYNIDIRKALTAEMIRRGFTYYDWNATAMDGGKDASVEGIVKNAKDTGADKNRIIMLLHDDKMSGKTAEALPMIISYYLDEGYTIAKITNDVRPIAFD